MREAAKRFRQSVAGVVGLVLLSAITGTALLAPVLFPGNPFQIVDKPFLSPFTGHFLGTDSLGRDMAVALAYGARTSLLIGVLSTLFAVGFGILVGGLSGFYGGRLDNFMMRMTEFFQTIPFFIFAIVIVAILSPSLRNIVLAISTVSWPPVARLVRGEFLSLRRREFVDASICLGTGDRAIILKDMLPNCTSPIIVTGSLMIATAILTESALSFLGLGDPNLMSWGFMIASGRTFLRNAWWLCAIPGIAILLTVLSINLVGEGLNDAMNPRLREM
jgi:peptide/nickel transport system permease protein